MSKIFPLDLTKATSELKKLISENPTLPIVVLVENGLTCDEFFWTYAPDIRFGISEILDCETPFYDEMVCNDRDEFEERLGDWLDDELEGTYTEHEFQERLAEEKAKYAPYWKKVIAIYAGT